MALSSTAVVKVLVVTDDLDRTAAAYEKLLGSSRTLDGEGKETISLFNDFLKWCWENLT